MTKRHLFALPIAASLFAIPTTAGAQEQPGYAANHFDPSERGSRWFALDSLDIAGQGRLALGLVNDYSYRSLVDYRNGSARDSIVRSQYLAHLGASMVVAERFRLGLSVPLQLFADGHTAIVNGVAHRAAEDAGVGDVRLALDARVLGAPKSEAILAVGSELFLPAGTPSAYTGDGKPRVLPRVLFAGQTSSIAYAARLGFQIRERNEPFASGQIGSGPVFGASVGVLLADKKLIVGPEIFGSTVTAHGRAFDARTTPLEVLLGGHYDIGENMRVGAGAGLGLTRGYGAPVVRGLLSLEWVPGDAAPEKAPVVATADRDGDGIPDAEDACGFTPGARSLDPARNGCPVADLPPVPPPPPPPPADRDGDGINDSEDACPDQAGVKDADPQKNGCPDPDRDHDGIPNDVDACPDTPGESNADPKKNGCPKAFLDNGSIRITDQVKFKTASAEIAADKDSDAILNAVLGVLKAHPEIAKLRVEGHTDDRGDAAKNKALSLARAKSVVKWLTTRGIEAVRLQPAGFGSERPVEANTTEEGRTSNRRVEFHVEEGSQR